MTLKRSTWCMCAVTNRCLHYMIVKKDKNGVSCENGGQTIQQKDYCSWFVKHFKNTRFSVEVCAFIIQHTNKFTIATNHSDIQIATSSSL